jgi:hypothetical protein
MVAREQVDASSLLSAWAGKAPNPRSAEHAVSAKIIFMETPCLCHDAVFRGRRHGIYITGIFADLIERNTPGVMSYFEGT